MVNAGFLFQRPAHEGFGYAFVHESVYEIVEDSGEIETEKRLELLRYMMAIVREDSPEVWKALLAEVLKTYEQLKNR